MRAFPFLIFLFLITFSFSSQHSIVITCPTNCIEAPIFISSPQNDPGAPDVNAIAGCICDVSFQYPNSCLNDELVITGKVYSINAVINQGQGNGGGNGGNGGDGGNGGGDGGGGGVGPLMLGLQQDGNGIVDNTFSLDSDITDVFLNFTLIDMNTGDTIKVGCEFEKNNGGFDLNTITSSYFNVLGSSSPISKPPGYEYLEEGFEFVCNSEIATPLLSSYAIISDFIANFSYEYNFGQAIDIEDSSTGVRQSSQFSLNCITSPGKGPCINPYQPSTIPTCTVSSPYLFGEFRYQDLKDLSYGRVSVIEKNEKNNIIVNATPLVFNYENPGFYPLRNASLLFIVEYKQKVNKDFVDKKYACRVNTKELGRATINVSKLLVDNGIEEKYYTRTNAVVCFSKLGNACALKKCIDEFGIDNYENYFDIPTCGEAIIEPLPQPQCISRDAYINYTLPYSTEEQVDYPTIISISRYSVFTPISPERVDNLLYNIAICLPIVLLFGLLFVSMYESGNNPFFFFDMSRVGTARALRVNYSGGLAKRYVDTKTAKAATTAMSLAKKGTEKVTTLASQKITKKLLGGNKVSPLKRSLVTSGLRVLQTTAVRVATTLTGALMYGLGSKKGVLKPTVKPSLKTVKQAAKAAKRSITHPLTTTQVAMELSVPLLTVASSAVSNILSKAIHSIIPKEALKKEEAFEGSETKTKKEKEQLIAESSKLIATKAKALANIINLYGKVLNSLLLYSLNKIFGVKANDFSLGELRMLHEHYSTSTALSILASESKKAEKNLVDMNAWNGSLNLNVRSPNELEKISYNLAVLEAYAFLGGSQAIRDVLGVNSNYHTLHGFFSSMLYTLLGGEFVIDEENNLRTMISKFFSSNGEEKAFLASQISLFGLHLHIAGKTGNIERLDQVREFIVRREKAREFYKEIVENERKSFGLDSTLGNYGDVYEYFKEAQKRGKPLSVNEAQIFSLAFVVANILEKSSREEAKAKLRAIFRDEETINNLLSFYDLDENQRRALITSLKQAAIVKPPKPSKDKGVEAVGTSGTAKEEKEEKDKEKPSQVSLNKESKQIFNLINGMERRINDFYKGQLSIWEFSRDVLDKFNVDYADENLSSLQAGILYNIKEANLEQAATSFINLRSLKVLSKLRASLETQEQQSTPIPQPTLKISLTTPSPPSPEKPALLLRREKITTPIERVEVILEDERSPIKGYLASQVLRGLSFLYGNQPRFIKEVAKTEFKKVRRDKNIDYSKFEEQMRDPDFARKSLTYLVALNRVLHGNDEELSLKARKRFSQAIQASTEGNTFNRDKFFEELNKIVPKTEFEKAQREIFGEKGAIKIIDSRYDLKTEEGRFGFEELLFGKGLYREVEKIETYPSQASISPLQPFRESTLETSIRGVRSYFNWGAEGQREQGEQNKRLNSFYEYNRMLYKNELPKEVLGGEAIVLEHDKPSNYLLSYSLFAMDMLYFGDTLEAINIFRKESSPLERTTLYSVLSPVYSPKEVQKPGFRRGYLFGPDLYGVVSSLGIGVASLRSNDSNNGSSISGENKENKAS